MIFISPILAKIFNWVGWVSYANNQPPKLLKCYVFTFHIYLKHEFTINVDFNNYDWKLGGSEVTVLISGSRIMHCAEYLGV